MTRFRSIVLVAALGIAGFGAVGAALADDDHKQSAEGKAMTLTGELIDAACFVSSDGDAKGKAHAECAQKCMASGVPAGILPEGAKSAGEALYLLTNPAVLAPYAAQTIRVEGTAYTARHAFDLKKLSVKDGTSWKEIPLKDEHHKTAAGPIAAPAAGAHNADGHTH